MNFVRIKENEKRVEYLDLAEDLKNMWIMRLIVTPTLIGVLDLVQSLNVWKGDWKSRKSQDDRDHPDNSIVKIGLNTEKSPGDLRRLAVTWTPFKDQQLALMWETRTK